MGLPIVQQSKQAVRAPQHGPQAGPTLRALDALWQQVSRRPLWAPPHFLRYLRLRSRMHLTLLDPKRVSLVTPAGKINDCGSCSDSCCIGSHNTVLLGLRDIARLMDAGRTSLMVHNKPQFSSQQLRRRPALRRHVQSSAWHTFPVLAQNSFGACRALTTEGRCSLHPHWPQSCARFPLSLHLHSAEVFYSKRCQSFVIHPRQVPVAERMQEQAVAAYNERIKDAVLLAYAPKRLQALGVMAYLQQ